MDTDLTFDERPLPVLLLGAVGGAAIAYLFFTDRGRRLCEWTASTLESSSGHVSRVTDAVRKLQDVYQEGRNLTSKGTASSMRM